MHPSPPRSTLFPYTTLFRSQHDAAHPHAAADIFVNRVGRFSRHSPTLLGFWRRDTKHRLKVLVAQKPSNPARDRKSTRLNSSHQIISYAVFCLKKKKKKSII